MQSKTSTLVGTTLGTCVLERLLGTGGMGMVFLAQQTRPAREVAVKILHPRTLVPEEERLQFLARFRREADVVAQLDHINILPIYEYGEQADLAYLVMPYLAGGSLRDLLTSRGTLSPQETLLYMEQIAAALDYAHLHRIVHRDIKPGNMLFHTDGRLVLADFGIARLLPDGHTLQSTVQTHSGLFLGSMNYMAPEMVQGRHVDTRADIYELGVVIFQLLCGQMPFQGTSPFLVAAKHVQELPPHLYKINSSLSMDIDGVVHKALAKAPEDRYQSAGELIDALRNAVSMAHTTSWNRELPRTTMPTLPTVLLQKEVYEQNDGSLSSGTNAHSEKQPSRLSSLPSGTRRGPFLALALVLLLLLGGLLVEQQVMKGFWRGVPSQSSGTSTSATSTPRIASTATLFPTQTSTSSQQAQALVQHYYDDINQANYQDAYNQWGSDYQKSLTYPQFSTGFSTTTHDDVVVRVTTLQNDGTITVEITLYATQATSSGTRLAAFEGHYIVGQENGTWKLLRADLQQTGTSSPLATPSAQNQDQAEAVVYHYYQAINASDYYTAYQLWDAEYQGTHTYTQFAKGFGATKHDEITITTVTQLSATVSTVQVVLKTTEEEKGGTATTTYSGNYAVGQEQGVWKLFTADLQENS